MRKRGRVALLLTVAVVGAGIWAAGLWLAAANTAAETGPPPVALDTVPIELGTLSGSIQVQGTLAFAGERKLPAGLGGTVTALPAPNARIGLGQGLYWVDNRPIVLLHGALPAWREFVHGMTGGPDVLQLETNLAALGFFSLVPDETFGTATVAAIKSWQKALGMPRTGVLDLGSVVFSPTDVRVSSIQAALGDQIGAGTAVLTLSSLDKQVEINLKLSEQQLAVVGTKVTVDLPGGVIADGTIISVGIPTEKVADGKTTVTVPVAVILDDPAVAGEIQRANVTVALPSETRENVLSVPVEALLALSEGGFGVEIVAADGTTKRVPVQTGLFAAGRVEISGKGIARDQDVAVPSL